MNLEDIPRNEVGKRAIEIAVAGVHSILFIGGPRTEAADLRIFANDLKPGTAISLWPCYCGNWMDEGRECICTIDEFRDYIFGTFIFGNDFDIVISVRPLQAHELLDGIFGKRKGESWGEMKERIGLATYYTDLSLNQTCLNLLKAATIQLGFNSRQIRRRVAVARTIANLAQRETIEVAHLAESIQYHGPSYYEWIKGRRCMEAENVE